MRPGQGHSEHYPSAQHSILWQQAARYISAGCEVWRATCYSQAPRTGKVHRSLARNLLARTVACIVVRHATCLRKLKIASSNGTHFAA